MSRWPRTPDGEPSIHQAALSNLRSFGKAAGIGIGGLAVVLAAFAGIAALIIKSGAPSAESIREQAAQAAGSAAPSAAAPTRSPAAGQESDWRKQTVAFLAAAERHGDRWRAWMPRGAGRFTYTPLSLPGQELSVVPGRLTAAQRTALTDSVTFRGKLDPSSFAVSSSKAAAGGWKLEFVVKVRGKGWVHGEAAGRQESGTTRITRVVQR